MPLRWARRLACGAALALAVFALRTPAAHAQKAPKLLHEEAALPLVAPAGAVAISADESILAAATPQSGGRWRVQLFDRPSKAKLGLIVAQVGAEPRLRFSPVDDLLLIAGKDSLQLWELPITPMDPDQPLAAEHRRWEVKLAAPAADADFGTPPEMVYWSQGAELHRRSVRLGVPFDDKPLWTAEDKAPPLAAFSFDPASALVALVPKQGKEIGLRDLNDPQAQRTLQGHRFPVVAARFSEHHPLLTLDAGHNLIQWRDHAQPVATTFLDQVPNAFKAAGFADLGDRYLLLEAPDGTAVAIDERTTRPVAELKADGMQRIAVSPTGRYVLAADGRTLHLYGFAQPASPLAYVRRLRRLKAFEMAQSYVRLMDDHGISPQLKADLLNEAGREPPGQELQTALARLQQAVNEKDSDRMRYWAEQVLSLQPGQPDAVAALRRLREQLDALTLTQAREAYEAGQNRVAISLLTNQIQDDSRYYPEALELIRQAEAKRSVETALIQARERMNLGDYVAAEALVNEALRKEPGNRAAATLQDEIDDRSGATQRHLLAAGIGLTLAVLLVGFVALRWRRKLEPYLRSLRMEEPRPGPGPVGAGRPQAAPHRAAEAREPAPERAPPRPQAAHAARRKLIEGLVKETEELLHTLRQEDVFGRYTARLMDLEAELSATARRVADPTAELGPLHNRVKTIHGKARAIRIEREAARETQREAPGNGPGARTNETAKAPPPLSDAGGTHYDVLQLKPDATPDEIKAAYHRLLKQYHPDLHNASTFAWVRAEAERMSRRIAEAYEVLGNANSRSRYDRELRSRKGPAR